MNKSKLAHLFSILLILSLGSFWCFLQLSLDQVDKGEPALNFLRPAFAYIVKSYRSFEFQPQLFYAKVLPAVAALWCLCALAGLIFRRSGLLYVCLVLLLPILAESAILLRHTSVGIGLHICGFLILVAVYRKHRLSAPQEEKRLPWLTIEIPLFMVIFTLVCIMRFYLIDRVPSGWDTETCGYRHIFFRSFFDVMRHEAGWDPKTTLGGLWLAIHVLLGHVEEPDNYYVYLRLLGVGISVLKFLTVFCCVRALCGSFPAFLSIIFVGFGPPEDWWAREPSFHHLPGLVALLIFWATARAFEQRRYRDFLLVAILTGLARLVYASGIFFAFAPISFFLLLIVFRWTEWKRHLLKISTLLLGLAFWSLWRSIAYWYVWDKWIWRAPIEIPGHTELPGGMFAKLYTLFVTNGLDALSTIFFQQANPTHWTVALTTAPARSVASVVLVLSVLGLARVVAARGGYLGLLLLICIAWSIFPGVTTQVADRRVGGLFVFLNILAAREAGLLLRSVSSSGATTLASVARVLLPAMILAHLGWMSAAFRFKEEGVPYQVIRSRLIRELLQPNSIYVLLSIDHGCNAFYGVYQYLRSCEMAWIQPEYIGPTSMEAVIANPVVNPKSWTYSQTELGACLSKYPASWQQVVFLVIEDRDAPKLFDQVRKFYPNGTVERKEHVTPNGTSYAVNAYKVPL